MRTPRPQRPEPIGKGGAILLSTNQLAFLHGLYDRPDGRAPSTADMVTAAIPYVDVLNGAAILSNIVRASRTLHPEWVRRVRNGRCIACELTPRGRAIVERTVPARVRGLGDYAGLAPMRAKRMSALPADVIERRWQAAVANPSLAALTAAAEALVTAWSRMNPCFGMAASMGKEMRRKRLTAYVRAYALRHRALPDGEQRVADGFAVAFDRLRMR